MDTFYSCTNNNKTRYTITINVCITGTSRGIGKTLAELYVEQGDFVIAGARKPFEESSASIIHITQDLSNPKKAADAFLEALENKKIDLLIHNAGVFPKKGADKLHNAEAKVITEAVFVNAAAPIEITRHLLSASAFHNNAKVVGISSTYGSISNTQSAKDYSYAMSKAAMNMGFCIMAHELEYRNIACFVLSPGWIKTDMGGQEAPLTLEQTCPIIINTIKNWSIGRHHFIDHMGKDLRW